MTSPPPPSTCQACRHGRDRHDPEVPGCIECRCRHFHEAAATPAVVDGYWSTPCLECEGTKVFHEPDGTPHTCWACKGMGWVPATPAAPVDDCQHIYLPAGPHENRDQCVTHGRVWPCPGRDWYGVPLSDLAEFLLALPYADHPACREEWKP